MSIYTRTHRAEARAPSLHSHCYIHCSHFSATRFTFIIHFSVLICVCVCVCVLRLESTLGGTWRTYDVTYGSSWSHSMCERLSFAYILYFCCCLSAYVCIHYIKLSFWRPRIVWHKYDGAAAFRRYKQNQKQKKAYNKFLTDTQSRARAYMRVCEFVLHTILSKSI